MVSIPAAFFSFLVKTLGLTPVVSIFEIDLSCFLLIFLIFFVLVICGTTRAVQQAAPPDRAAGVQGRRCTSAPLDTIDPSPGSLSFLAPSLPSPPALPVHTGRRRCVRAVRASATATATAAHPLLGNDGVVSRALRGLQRLQLRSLLQTLLPRGLRLLRRA